MGQMAIQYWSLYYRKDIARIESIQRWMTKMIQGIRNLTYKERLKSLNLHSLERCRIRGDLIEVYKWVKQKRCRDGCKSSGRKDVSHEKQKWDCMRG